MRKVVLFFSMFFASVLTQAQSDSTKLSGNLGIGIGNIRDHLSPHIEAVGLLNSWEESELFQYGLWMRTTYSYPDNDKSINTFLSAVNFLSNDKITKGFGFGITGLQSQNLLYNGSFEDCLGCPDEPGALKVCEYWSIPNHATPDLFKRCSHSTPYLEIPYNFIGTQEPKSGSAYVGIILIEGSERYRDYREYIQGELNETLQANTLYMVTFYMSWAEYTNYFCDRIGYLFSADQLTPRPKEPEPKKRKKKKRQEPEEQPPLNTILPESNGYVHLELDTLMDRESWHKVEFTYRAKGGEKYMTLGLFGDNATEEDYERYTGEVFGKPLRIGQASYYYIDDISVEKSAFTHH